ncbi:hypothetical protein NEOLEDRAFT_1070900, partial [Neolentinus lepideus HHB14362 ss-1]
LLTFGIFYEYVLLDGHRIIPTSRLLRKTAGSSIVKVLLNGQYYTRELVSVFWHAQSSLNDKTLWAEISWMRKAKCKPFMPDPWEKYLELEIKFCKFGRYHDLDHPDAPPQFIKFNQISCQLAHGQHTSMKPKLWITTSMARVCTLDTSSYILANQII